MNKKLSEVFLFNKLLIFVLCFCLLSTTGLLTSISKVEASVTNPTPTQMPSNYIEANNSLRERLGMMLEYKVQQTFNELYNYNEIEKKYFATNRIERNAKVDFGRIYAVLMNMKINNHENTNIRNGYNLVTDVMNIQPDMPQLIENWITGIDVKQSIGTSGDYNMKFKEMINILYQFKQPEDNIYLTDDAAFELVNRGFVEGYELVVDESPIHGTSTSHMVNRFYEIADNPESENHVLMIYSTMYLVNQYVTNNYRNDNRFRTGNYSNYESKFNNTDLFEEHILNILQRSVHSDFFEFNSRPYLHHSLVPVFNLYSYADSARIRQAAKNVIDFVSAKYAFMSLEGKSYGPMRRSSNNDSYLYNIGLYKGSGTLAIMGMLSGGYVWNDYFQDWDADHDNYAGVFKSYNPYALITGFMSDYDLMLGYGSTYKMPKQIHQFYLDKLDGYWARFMPRYGNDYRWEYSHGDGDNRWAYYFSEDGKRNMDIHDMRFTPEGYFVTNDFLHTMGGNYDDNPYDDSFPHDDIMTGYFYDGLTKNTALLPKGDISDWGSTKDGGSGYDNMREDVFHFTNWFNEFWNRSNMTGTYKNFSASGTSNPYVILHEPDRFDGSFMNIYNYDNENNNYIGYTLYDLTSNPENCYLVTGRVAEGPDFDEGDIKEFWEIIPSDRFSNLTELKNNHVLAKNNAQSFFHLSSNHYIYELITGEQVLLNKSFGVNTSSLPIHQIKDEDGKYLNDYEYYFNNYDEEKHPLMDVRAVDENYEYTGEKYAYSRGDGLIQIYNPSSIIGEEKYFIIDSRNIFAPDSYESSFSHVNMTGKTEDSNGDYNGLAITIRTRTSDASPTEDDCKIMIKYDNGSGGHSTKHIKVRKTDKGDSYTVYWMPPNGDLSNLKNISLRRDGDLDDPWNTNICVEYKGQTIWEDSVFVIEGNQTYSLTDTDYKIGRLYATVQCQWDNNAGSTNDIYFRIKLKDGTVKDYFMAYSIAAYDRLEVPIGHLDFPLSEIDQIGVMKKRSMWYESADDLGVTNINLRLGDTGAYWLCDEWLYSNTDDFWITQSNKLSVEHMFDVNYSGASNKNRITEPLGMLRVHLRQAEDGWFSDPKTNDKFVLRIGYSKDRVISYDMIPTHGFDNREVFEPSSRDFFGSVIINKAIPRHEIEFIELYKPGNDGFDASKFRIFVDDKKVFEKSNFKMGDNSTKHWDVNGL